MADYIHHVEFICKMGKWGARLGKRFDLPFGDLLADLVGEWAGFSTVFTPSVGGFMAYTEAAIVRRRCTATRQDGEPCRAWAMWDDPGQRCNVHAGRAKSGPHASRFAQPGQPARYVPCRCAAYNWPHRPGSGPCRWPDPPAYRCRTPAGTHRMTFRRRWRGTRLVYERR